MSKKKRQRQPEGDVLGRIEQELRGADGFIVVHTPPEGKGVSYGHGPFPPDMRLLEQMGIGTINPTCGCFLSFLVVTFPRGVKMMVDATEQVMAIVRDLTDDEPLVH